MDKMSNIIAARREAVIQSYHSAKAENNLKYLEGDQKATAEYIFENQIVDANYIVRDFNEKNYRVISITKKTKVGMDGLMIQIATLMTTHPNDKFVVNPANVRIITGMSNASWEKDMKEKAPSCFKDKIFHHGKLKRADLNGLENGFVFIDEIDTGNKEFQVLHTVLKESGMLDVKHMEKYNNRFVFASATMIKELYDLYQWGDLHKLYKMTIPENYIGHIEFLKMGIIKEFYPLNSDTNAEKWIQEDIIDNYGSDFRVHIVRSNPKCLQFLQDACIRKNIKFYNHNSDDGLSEQEIKELFNEPLKKHTVLIVKGFFRRANLIPNDWKLRIGATHELYTKTVDNNVQVQGFPGRMSGYWKNHIDSGHKTGPHRTSIKSIEEYEKVFNDPFGINSYRSSGFKKRNGKVTAEPTMISPKNIDGLEAIPLPVLEECKPKNPVYLEEFNSMDELNTRWLQISISNKKHRSPLKDKTTKKYMCALGTKSQVHTVEDIRTRRYDCGTHEWGSGITNANLGEYVARVYVGYDGDKEIYFLRWTIK
jgi:hypothetical protein